ncbi:MAG: cellulose biosynthesis protein BcsS [Hyphomicrobiaceae bacterium]
MRLSFSVALRRLIAFAVLGGGTARAENDDADKPPPAPLKWDTWSGYFATPETSFGYAGLTYALNGDKNEDGWRIRLQGGGGTYGYTSTRTDGLNEFNVDFLGRGTIGEALLGYQMRFGEITGKLFLGAAYQNHIVNPFDADNPVVGEVWGGKLTVEGWMNIGEASFASLDASYATPFQSYSGQVRYGQSIWDRLWIGGELGGYGNEELNAGKLGGFLRWQTGWGTFWLAGGVSGDYDDPSTPYGSFTYVKSF